ncbi:hypothetical protein PV08_01359 [Exophiala spinifera]|uniref:Amino acid permease/ SLC12A domain-containing protein n=1 Tax=Exophiala spinifera TaxID=91928 RepID=A0A0D1YZN6_9EURO|nr:uncharacterized protein PV08_01359 [Exophiala spinifera]KIW20781.1 hypothetical protein PV08_01359 [Exophiala spinifera]
MNNKLPPSFRIDMDDKKAWSPESSSEPSAFEGDMHQVKRTFTRRLTESFKRDPNASVTRSSISAGDNHHHYDAEAAAQATAMSPLLRRLKGRHLQMIAIGGSIGTGLFVSSGRALAYGGPASLLIAFTLTGCMLYCTVQALGELAVLFPVAGSFAAYSTRFLDPAWGFAMGWNYAMQWLVVLPLEIVSASITVDYWIQNVSLNAAWVAIFLVMIAVINFFGVKAYGEAEFVFSVIKVTAVIGYILLGVLVNIMGGVDSNGRADGSYMGFRLWHHPGAFHNGFKGLCSTFVTAAFAFAGTELVGLAAAETENPRKTLPTAIKQVFWRITLFYIVSLLIVGTLVPYDDPRLLNGQSNADTKASPFVISIQNAGLAVLPSVMNVVIMISVLSVGNSSIYGSSRTLAALAEQRQAPSFLAYIDRKGRPLYAIIISTALGFLAFLAASAKQQDAFNWMLALSGLSSIFTWGSICLAHIRFRKAWIEQGHTLDELAFRSPVGVVGSWIGLGFNIIVLIAQFWTGFSPVGYASESASDLVINFFQAYLAAPVVVIMYIGYKVYMRTSIIKTRDMDLFTGKREMNVKSLVAEERADRLNWPTWKKVYKFLC